MVSKSSWNWHSLELQGHGCSTFQISELEESSGHASIGVEELPGGIVVFREFDVIDFSIVFTVIIDDVNGFFVEQFSDLRVLVDHISQVGFLDIRVKGSVSESGVENEPRKDRDELETEGNVGEHVEGQRNTWEGIELEVIIESVSSLPPSAQTWEPSELEVLDPGVEHRSGGLGILWLSDMIMFKVVLWISVVCVLPFEFPSLVVWVATLPGDLVSDGHGNETSSSQGVESVEVSALGGSKPLLDELGSVCEHVCE